MIHFETLLHLQARDQSTNQNLTNTKAAKMRQNLHLINSLKRILQASRATTSKIRISLGNLSSFTIMAICCLIFLLGEPIVSKCDSNICPRDLRHMYPCSCQNGTLGLLVKCSRVNLAILSKSLGAITESVEQVEIESSSISRVFGGLFNDSQSYPFHATIRELDIRASGVLSIDAASFSQQLLQNIQYLMFDRNNLQQVPSNLVNNMASLRLLNLSTNAITGVEANAFVKLTNLTDLDLSSNLISRVNKNSFNSLTSLEFLTLSGNELAGKLERNVFAQLRKLRHLDLSNNKLTSLDRQDFNELTALETLRVANNQISTIPRSIFSRNAKLFTLDISFNRLDDIDTYLFKSTRFLKDLNMAGNLIKEINKNSFSPTTRIKHIDLSQNMLQAIAPETFKGLEWLERIDLSHNQIVNISTEAFSKMFQPEIDLSHNKVARIYYWAFHEVSNMSMLNLSHNLIEDNISPIAFESSDCAHLDLSHNLIEDISKFPVSNLTGLRQLDVSHNQITEFNKKSFSEKRPMYELHTIDASHNNISQISGNIFERLRSLRLFNVSHNSLRRLTSNAFGSSPTLLELDLSHNNLVEIVSGTLANLISLKRLDLRHNRLKKMIPIPAALNSIQLEHNEIGHLSKAAFPSLNSLLELYLDHNRLTNIEEGTFATLLALHTLSLSYNNISSIPAPALKDMVSLQNLRLSGNNIQRLARRAFGSLPIVFTLSLDHNNISSLADHAFDGMLQLLQLNISHNNLAELPAEAFAGLASLRQLDLSNNQLNRFENKSRSAMEDLLSLEQLDLSHNKLSLITPRSFLSSPYIPYRLARLDLSHNLIGILVGHFANGLKRLEWLSLRANIINEIQPYVLSNITQLKHLDLSHNKLRLLKEATFGSATGSELANLTTILLNNNKLARIQRPREFDKLRSLAHLDLSNNRLESVFAEWHRWLRRGMVLDLRHNNLDCGCDQLPLVAWVDNFRARNHSYSMIMSQQHDHHNHHHHQQQQQQQQQQQSALAYERLARNQPTSALLPQYIEATERILNLSCAKPDAISGKSVMQMLDLVNSQQQQQHSSLQAQNSRTATGSPSASNEFNCDKDNLDEADLLKRLKAPIQFTGAQPYISSGEHHLQIGWSLLDTQIDLTHFTLLRTRFAQPFDLSHYRTSPPTSPSSSASAAQQFQASRSKIEPNFQLIEHEIERISYEARTHVLRNLNARHFYVVCITYETGSGEHSASSSSSSSSTLPTPSPTIMIEQLNKTTTSGQSTLMAAIIADYSRINCASLNSLVQNDVSERLISASSRPAQLLAMCLTTLSSLLSILSALGYGPHNEPRVLFRPLSL